MPPRRVGLTIRGIGLAILDRPGIFVGVAPGVLADDLLLPILILSLARGPFTHPTINPGCPGCRRGDARPTFSWTLKLRLVFAMALAWPSRTTHG
jgi:hypothetical protein